MQVLLGMFIAMAGIFLVMVLRSLTTLFHEMGHAVPSLMFTDQPVQVYIGTYGDISNCWRMQFGRLEIFFRLNLMDWKIGMCRHSGIKNLWQHFFVIIGGPIASLLISIPLFWIIFTKDLSETWVAILGIFILAAIIDFFVNIIPINRAVNMHDGAVTYNDGTQLVELLGRMTLSKEYFDLEEKFERKEYNELIHEAHELISNGNKEYGIYMLVLESFMAQERYEDALSFFGNIKEKFKLNTDDYHRIGKIYLKLGKYEEALKYLQHCFHHNYQDSNLLNDIAFIRIQQREFKEALIDLDAAITYGPNNIEAFANRGYVLIRLEAYEAAKKNLLHAHQLTDTHPYIPYYLGLLHEEIGNKKEALAYYEEAKRRNVDEAGINFKIEMMRD